MIIFCYSAQWVFTSSKAQSKICQGTYIYWPIHIPVCCALINTFVILQKCPVYFKLETHIHSSFTKYFIYIWLKLHSHNFRCYECEPFWIDVRYRCRQCFPAIHLVLQLSGRPSLFDDILLFFRISFDVINATALPISWIIWNKYL